MFDLLDILYIIDLEKVRGMLRIDGLLSEEVEKKIPGIRKFIDKYLIISSGNTFGENFSENTGKYCDGALVCEIYYDEDVNYYLCLEKLSNAYTTTISDDNGVIEVISSSEGIWNLFDKKVLTKAISSQFSVGEEVVSDILSCYILSMRVINPSGNFKKIVSNVGREVDK